MKASAVDGASGSELGARSVTLAVGGPGGPTKAFLLRPGDVLRVGRGTANDFVLDLAGVSTCHTELFLRQGDGPGEGTSARDVGPGLFARDTSKNGTGVLMSFIGGANGSADGSSPPASWRALPRGGLVRLQDGWRLLLPLRGRPKDATELAHTLTVRVSPAAPTASGVPTVKAKTPRRGLRIGTRTRAVRRAVAPGAAPSAVAAPGATRGVSRGGAAPGPGDEGEVPERTRQKRQRPGTEEEPPAAPQALQPARGVDSPPAEDAAAGGGRRWRRRREHERTQLAYEEAALPPASPISPPGRPSQQEIDASDRERKGKKHKSKKDKTGGGRERRRRRREEGEHAREHRER